MVATHLAGTHRFNRLVNPPLMRPVSGAGSTECFRNGWAGETRAAKRCSTSRKGRQKLGDVGLPARLVENAPKPAFRSHFDLENVRHLSGVGSIA